MGIAMCNQDRTQYLYADSWQKGKEASLGKWSESSATKSSASDQGNDSSIAKKWTKAR